MRGTDSTAQSTFCVSVSQAAGSATAAPTAREVLRRIGLQPRIDEHAGVGIEIPGHVAAEIDAGEGRLRSRRCSRAKRIASGENRSPGSSASPPTCRPRTRVVSGTRLRRSATAAAETPETGTVPVCDRKPGLSRFPEVAKFVQASGDDGGSGEEEQRCQTQVPPPQRAEEQDGGRVEQRQAAPAHTASDGNQRGQREEPAIVGQVRRAQLRDVEQPWNGRVLERIAPATPHRRASGVSPRHSSLRSTGRAARPRARGCAAASIRRRRKVQRSRRRRRTRHGRSPMPR